jgi:hypothetical protein
MNYIDEVSLTRDLVVAASLHLIWHIWSRTFFTLVLGLRVAA